jgi:hypothetical protein
MTSTSKMVPDGVQTGFLKGWRLAAQKLKGRRRKGAAALLEEERAPTLAEKASEDDHSEWVICAGSISIMRFLWGGDVGVLRT